MVNDLSFHFASLWVPIGRLADVADLLQLLHILQMRIGLIGMLMEEWEEVVVGAIAILQIVKLDV